MVDAMRKKTAPYRAHVLGDGETMVVRGTMDVHQALAWLVEADQAGREEWTAPWDGFGDILRHDHLFEGEGMIRPKQVAMLGDAMQAMVRSARAGWWRFNVVPPGGEYKYMLYPASGPGRGNWQGVEF